MEGHAKEVIVAVDNVPLRNRLGRLVRIAGCRPVLLSSSFEVRKMTLSRDDVVIVETDDDMAALTQAVYEIHISSGLDAAPAIIGVLSTDAAQRNIAVCRWNIGGHAALAALVTSDDPDFDKSVPILIQRLKAGKADG
jgi:hypothetical protein